MEVIYETLPTLGWDAIGWSYAPALVLRVLHYVAYNIDPSGWIASIGVIAWVLLAPFGFLVWIFFGGLSCGDRLSRCYHTWYEGAMTRALILLSIPFHVFLLAKAIGTWHAFEIILLFLPFVCLIVLTLYYEERGIFGHSISNKMCNMLSICWTVPGGLLTGLYAAQVRLPMAFEVEADNWFMIAGLCRIVWFLGMIFFTGGLMSQDNELSRFMKNGGLKEKLIVLLSFIPQAAWWVYTLQDNFFLTKSNLWAMILAIWAFFVEKIPDMLSGAYALGFYGCVLQTPIDIVSWVCGWIVAIVYFVFNFWWVVPLLVAMNLLFCIYLYYRGDTRNGLPIGWLVPTFVCLYVAYQFHYIPTISSKWEAPRSPGVDAAWSMCDRAEGSCKGAHTSAMGLYTQFDSAHIKIDTTNQKLNSSMTELLKELRAKENALREEADKSADVVADALLKYRGKQRLVVVLGNSVQEGRENAMERPALRKLEGVYDSSLGEREQANRTLREARATKADLPRRVVNAVNESVRAAQKAIVSFKTAATRAADRKKKALKLLETIEEEERTWESAIVKYEALLAAESQRLVEQEQSNRQLQYESVAMSLTQGAVAEEDIGTKADVISPVLIRGATKVTPLSEKTAVPLEGEDSDLVPMQILSGTADPADEAASVGKAIGERRKDGTWRIRYQAPEPEDRFDLSAYGKKDIKVTFNGTTILSDTVVIAPNQNIRPAPRYVFRNALTDAEIEVDSVTSTIVDASDTKTTMAAGELPKELADGRAKISIDVPGFETHSQEVLVFGKYRKDAPEEVVFLRPTMKAHTLSATLRWGEKPLDLDLHCVSSNGAHVFFKSKKDEEVELDIDETKSFGPETVTVGPKPGVSYSLWVHRYTDDGDLALSTATIELRVKLEGHMPAELRRISVPTNPTTNLPYWHALTVVIDENKGYVIEYPNALVADEPPAPKAGGGATQVHDEV